MMRRHFLTLSPATLAAALGKTESVQESIDADWYRRSRRQAALPMSRVAYVERGSGPVALFLHGFPLNGFQWRGALERLHRHRRCLVPDLMGMGYSETPETQTISPETQAMMLASLLDFLHVDSVDLVANDSGGLVAQLFLAWYPQRVRTLLLTNCDVDKNNPPANFLPVVALAQKGLFAERFLIPQLLDKQGARSAKGIGQAYTYPERLTDETIEIYFRPLVASPLRKAQINQYAVSLGTNVLIAVRENLHRWRGAARLVWAMNDSFFGVEWAEWLHHTLSGSLGVQRVEGANLFFPEEMPDLIANEAIHLWRASPKKNNAAGNNGRLGTKAVTSLISNGPPMPHHSLRGIGR